MAVYQKESRTENPLQFDALSVLGGVLLGQRRHAEAEPLVLAGYEKLNALGDRPSLKRAKRLRDDASERVVRLYESWGKPEQAAVWKARIGLADLPADVFALP